MPQLPSSPAPARSYAHSGFYPGSPMPLRKPAAMPDSPLEMERGEIHGSDAVHNSKKDIFPDS